MAGRVFDTARGVRLMTDQPTAEIMTARICLDFGTAFSKASAFSDGQGPAREAVRALAIGAAAGSEHPLLTPSVMFVDDGRILFFPSNSFWRRATSNRH